MRVVHCKRDSYTHYIGRPSGAIRAGSELAPGVVFGYYMTRIVEAVAAPLGFLGVATIAGYIIRKCVLRYAEVDELNVKAGLW